MQRVGRYDTEPLQLNQQLSEGSWFSVASSGRAVRLADWWDDVRLFSKQFASWMEQESVNGWMAGCFVSDTLVSDPDPAYAKDDIMAASV